MGTNFWWRPAPDKEPRLHVGKRSGAGGGLCSFMFEGVKDGPDGPIDSWARWRQVILLPGSVLWNEYGEIVDPLDFIADVESTTVENRRRQYDWVQAHKEQHPWSIRDFDDWLCPDGFSFTYGAFS